MQRPPEAKKTVFFGLIDDIRKVVDFSSGQPQRAVQVTGRGFSKAFVNFDVGVLNNGMSAEFNEFYNLVTLLMNCNSWTAIDTVIKAYVGKSINYRFGNGKTFESYFKYTGNKHKNETLVDYTSYTTYNGSLWNFIKELSNSPFNETYWEVVNERPNLVHRRTPFNKEDWITLKQTVIKDMDIVSDNTGRSDLETYTIFSVHLSMMDDVIDTWHYPLWYPPFYHKYGLTQLSVQTSYEVLSEDAVDDFFQDLFNFNIKNNVFTNGTIVVKGSNKYKVGERILVESDNMEFYVESVSHNFNCYGSWTTSLGVTRGIHPEERFTEPWGCAGEFTPAVIEKLGSLIAGEEVDWTQVENTSTINTPVYNEEEDETINMTGGSGTYGTPSENEKSIYDILRGWGLNNAACAAVLANIDAESKFVTDVWGDNHSSLGLCQWHAGRCSKLQNYCRENGYKVESVEGQMAYLKTELEENYSSTWNALTSCPDTPEGAYEAAKYWCIHFEVPKDKERKGRERGDIAKFTYYPRYS